ncbi:FKBP-type peptidyl-prolyl cis-trans isomerase [Bacteriovoracaceae bacterium]|nr:FKBP-type peptidyl-prolyl cis-trans isomerase [Bacteriovoracaceae bacterium]
MNTDQEKVSYIIGRQVGGDFLTQGIDVNLDIFFNGVKDGFAETESKISPEETQTIMNAFQEKMQKAQAELSQKLGEQNLTQGKAYLEVNQKADGVTVTSTGLQYKVVTSGTGKSPSNEDSVEVHYEGSLVDGTIFDSSYKRGQTTSFPVNGVIPGWTEALQLMKEGDVWELAIPSEIAYGEQGAGQVIPPHAVLKFKVELIKVL